MRGARFLRLVAFAGLISCGESSSATKTRSVTQAIQGGSPDISDSYAVAVRQGAGLCSGTLIAPNLVLTARHCIEATMGEGGACENGTLFTDASSLRVVVASALDADGGGGMEYVAAKLLAAPDVSTGCSPDIALVELAIAIPNDVASPARPAVTAADVERAHFPARVTAIGFGYDDQETPGTKHVKEDIDVLCVPGDSAFPCSGNAFEDYQIVAAAGPCEGDSGGGLYDQDSYDAKAPVVVATVVGGPVNAAGGCGNAIHTRVDKFASFIVTSARAAAKDGDYATPNRALPLAIAPAADSPSKPETIEVAASSTSSCALSRSTADGFFAGLLGLIVIACLRRRQR